MVRDMDQLSKIECSIKRGKWAEVLQALKLSDAQREQLMANRKEHLNKLRRIFQERQELNMQVCYCHPSFTIILRVGYCYEAIAMRIESKCLSSLMDTANS